MMARHWADFPKTWPRNALATTIVILFCFMVIWVFTHNYPEANARIVYFLGGQVAGYVSMILAFYFGSSDEDVQHRARAREREEGDP